MESKSKIILFLGWDGLMIIPFLLYLKNQSNIDILKIYSQGTHQEFLDKYDDFLSENYNNSLYSSIKILKINDKFKIIKSANNKKLISEIKDLKPNKIFFLSYGEILKKSFLDYFGQISMTIHRRFLHPKNGLYF